MCCETSSGTRAVVNNDFSSNTRDADNTNNNNNNNNNNNDNNNNNNIITDLVNNRRLKAARQREVRLGLLQNIVKGSGNIVDDTLDLILQPYYTEDDQQRLANRIAKSG